MKSLTAPAARYWIPALLCAAELVGLISALLGSGLYDVVAWIALAAPLFAIGAYLVSARLRRLPADHSSRLGRRLTKTSE